MNINSIAAGAKAAARLDRKNRRERIALECLKVLLDSSYGSPCVKDPISEAVGKAIHAADLLIAALNKEEEAAS